GFLHEYSASVHHLLYRATEITVPGVIRDAPLPAHTPHRPVMFRRSPQKGTVTTMPG
ncbi:hypothetical protein EC960427_2320, partial [Escherichia coli 96.0427]